MANSKTSTIIYTGNKIKPVKFVKNLVKELVSNYQMCQFDKKKL